MLHHAVSLFEVLLTGHAVGLRCNFLEVTLFGKEEVDRIIFDGFLFGKGLNLFVHQKQSLSWLSVVFDHIFKLSNNDLADLFLVIQDRLHLLNFIGKRVNLFGPFENIFLINMSKLDLRYIFCLYLINSKGNHEVWNNLFFRFRFSNDADCLVDIKQNLLQALKQMELFLFLVEVKIDPSADTHPAKSNPFFQQFPHAQYLWRSANQDIEVTGKAVFQWGETVELLHHCIWVCAALKVNRKFQAGKIGFITHIRDFSDLVCLDQIDHLVDNCFGGGGWWNFGDLDAVAALIITITCPDLKRTASGPVDLVHLCRIVDNLSAARKIRCSQRQGKFMVWILNQLDSGAAHLFEVKGTDRTCHTYRDAGVCVDQHRWKGHRQQGRFLELVVVVIHKIYRVLVNIPKQLLTDWVQLYFGVSGSCKRHITRICLTEVTLRIDIRVQKCFVSAGKTHQRFIDCHISMRI